MYYIGVDLGGTNIAVGLLDKDFKIIAKEKCPTRTERDISEIMDDMGALCNTLIKNNGLTSDDIAYIGIATPGSVEPPIGLVTYSNNVKMENYPITDELSARTGVKKVLVENDANAAALGEALMGAGKGKDNVIMITLGTGVGGGIVINRKLYSGFNYAGGELGHIVIKTDGRICSCGRQGCWEAYSSATGLKNMTKEKLEATKDTIMWEMIEGDLENVSGRTAFDAAKKGDKAGKEVVDEYIYYLACGIANMINIFQPDVLCIGGGVCGEGDYLLKPLTELTRKQEYGYSQRTKFTEIKIAELGNDAGIIGAGLLGQ
ncbi:MAG: ROK family protein [Clostridia bacterium]|nr:ROK family protein [Clostridia bacterium]